MTAERIKQLEDALQEAIDYLDRLPFHPMTVRARKRAAEVLDDTNGQLLPVQRGRSGTMYNHAGVVLFQAELHGDVLYLSAPKNEMADQQRLSVLRSGAAAFSFTELGELAPFTGLEADLGAGKRRQPGFNHRLT